MTHEGEVQKIDSQTARAFYRTLDLKGFELAVHMINRAQGLNPEQPLHHNASG